ncbi:MAG TPA: pepsin/retropepsin-like aspartic protease family protein [Pyrinomonadaceae bacterium]
MNLTLGLPLRLVAVAASILSFGLASRGAHQQTQTPAPLAQQSASRQTVSKIPFEITDGGHIFLRVRVNGSEPLWFGLDSGAEETMISARQAQALNLKLQGETKAAGGGEELVDFATAKNVSFDLSGVKFSLREVGVLPLEFPSPVKGETIGGLLGYDFLKRFVVEIDYTTRTINLYQPRSYRYRGGGEIVPIRMLDNNPHVFLRVKLPGLAPVAGMFLIDSGADTDLFFNSPFVKRHKLLNSTQQTTEASSLGIGGASKIRIGYATSVEIGRSVIENPVAHFSQAAKGDSASSVGAGFIGGKILKRFKIVIFDPTRHRLILEMGQR